MKILIIGEFSSFAKNLKEGFVALGHDVTIVHTGDGFKSISGDEKDIIYDPTPSLHLGGKRIPKSYMIKIPLQRVELSKRIKRKGVFDLIIIINDGFISKGIFEIGIDYDVVKFYREKGSKVIFTSCGRDAANLKYCKELRYTEHKFPDGIIYPVLREHGIIKLKQILGLVDVVIPTGYDYWYTIKRFCVDYKIGVKITDPIFLPITIKDASITSCNDRKINIMHGIIRANEKGTPFFIDALNRIKNDFPEKANVYIVEHLPLAEYEKLFDTVDILLDQTNSYCMGMNAEIGLMKGKVVFTGNEPEQEKMSGVKCPAINAVPDSDILYKQLVELINNPNEILRIKRDSRDFAIKYLDSKIIAQKYLRLVGLSELK